MSTTQLIREAREGAGLTQQQFAERAHTSRTAVSAYEQGHKSPTLSTFMRLMDAAGAHLHVTHDPPPKATNRLRTHPHVPDALPRLDVHAAFADVQLPLHIAWSEPSRIYRLSDRGDRARAYEAVLREGDAADVATFIDGALLADLWPELILPRSVRAAWEPLLPQSADPR